MSFVYKSWWERKKKNSTLSPDLSLPTPQSPGPSRATTNCVSRSPPLYHQPSVTARTHARTQTHPAASWLVSNSLLAPSSLLSKSSLCHPALFISCPAPFRGFHVWQVSPCLRLQPCFKQVHSLEPNGLSSLPQGKL